MVPASRICPSERQIFINHHVFLIPSLLFTKRAAQRLLERLREHGGDGRVLPHAEEGFRSVQTLLKDHSGSASQQFVVADSAILSKYSHLCALPLRPTRWLQDSLRDLRIKSPDLYPGANPSPQTCLSVQPSPNPPTKRNLNFTEFRAEVNYSTLSPPSKRRKISDASANSNYEKPEPPSQKAEKPTVAKNLLPLFEDSERNSQVNNSSLALASTVRSGTISRWACEIRPMLTASDYPMNVMICELLGIVQEAYSLKKDHFRSLGYQRAIAKIRTLSYEILTTDDVDSLGVERAIGARMQRKIVEIITTRRLLQAEAVLNNPQNVAVKTLCNIWGVGPVKAMGLVARGITTISQLRKASAENKDLLDMNQRIGLKRYEDLLHRIPRRHVGELERYVRKITKQVDTSLDITVAGSYLRGKSSCGDVDIMVVGSSEKLRHSFPKVIKRMRQEGVLTDDLIEGPGKYFGIFKFPGRRHGRIDLFAVPHEQYPYALLTYTGSAVFNR
ncbi:DNA polymerase lambda lyase [Gracilaria domingensis]|nr:DNA polymerase lambda lyase [Gracilaria domingensis]